jgi:hypothetical protein
MDYLATRRGPGLATRNLNGARALAPIRKVMLPGISLSGREIHREGCH